jgi:hypothetical protein
VLQAAGVDVECSLQTAAAELAVGRRPSDRQGATNETGGQGANNETSGSDCGGGTRRLRQDRSFPAPLPLRLARLNSKLSVGHTCC